MIGHKITPILYSTSINRDHTPFTLAVFVTTHLQVGFGDIENFLPRLLWSLLSRLLQISRY